jgi:N6-adenosine-specific RNA methylase IME4
MKDRSLLDQQRCLFDDLSINSSRSEVSSAIVHKSSIGVRRRKCDDLEMKKAIEASANTISGKDLLRCVGNQKFGTILCDPPWQFQNRTGKVAPEHKRLARYGTLNLRDIMAMPVSGIAAKTAHLYLWCPNALLAEGLEVMKAWGFQYKSNLVWHKIRKDGGSDGRGVGFYFRNVTELILFGVRGPNARTLKPGRTQVNYLSSRKREHSRKPDEQYDIITSCSRGPFIELFARGERAGWVTWGNQADENYSPTWSTYANHSQSTRAEA